MASRKLFALPPLIRVTIARSTTNRFSVLNRPPPNYEGHVPLNVFERGTLAVGSAVMSLMNPRRAGMFTVTNPHSKILILPKDLIAALGETTATPFFIYRLRDTMLSHPTGRRILRERPRITSKTLSVTKLRALPESSVGRAYVTWLDREGVSPDTRDSVKYIDDEECAYVMQRYRESHDFYHALTGLPVFVEGEVALKAFEFVNTLLPMTGLSLFAVTKMKPAERTRIWNTYLPWAVSNGLRSKDIINVYWEEELERDVDELRKDLGIERPPDLRDTRKSLKEQRSAAKEKRDTMVDTRAD